MEPAEETEPIIILDPEQEELGKIRKINISLFFQLILIVNIFTDFPSDLNHGRVGKIENLEPLTQLKR